MREIDTREAAISVLKEKINSVMKANSIEVLQIILFGSRARGDFKIQSDWDVLVVVKERLSVKEKMLYSKTIRESLAKVKIDCDVIIKSEQEFEGGKKMFGSLVREAMKEGISI
ncbi:MAG: nucleotidyltransferase domain-containing protein [Thermoplasmata archaeon]